MKALLLLAVLVAPDRPTPAQPVVLSSDDPLVLIISVQDAVLRRVGFGRLEQVISFPFYLHCENKAAEWMAGDCHLYSVFHWSKSFKLGSRRCVDIGIRVYEKVERGGN